MDQSPLIQAQNAGNASTTVGSTANITSEVIPDTRYSIEPAKDVAPGSPKILVVDDEADAAILFAELLNTTGKYIVQTAQDGIQCLEKCENTKFDLVLLDIVMPKLDGVDTLTRIIQDPEKYGKPKVIMLTNIGGDLAIEKALELGAIGFKLKIDTEPEELLKTIDSALKGLPIQKSTNNYI